MLGLIKQVTPARNADSEDASASPDIHRTIQKLNTPELYSHPVLDTKQLIRSLRYLRDDLKIIYPKLNLPSARMIRCLVESTLHTGAEIQDTPDFNNQVIGLLQHILCRCESGHSIRHSFKDLDGITPLFPNEELYGPQHVRNFVSKALQYLGAA